MPDRRPNNWLSLIAWLLPSCGFKLWALRSLGNHIGHDVTLGPNLVLNCGPFSIADGAEIMNFNIFRRLSSIELGPRSTIGNFNQFTAAPDYQRYSPLVGKLIVGEFGAFTNRHYVDCSGQVILRPFAAVGGVSPMNSATLQNLATTALPHLGRDFHFQIDAELIVYGTTEPHAKVTLQGEPVTLRNDGTFTVRFSLPDSRQIIPAVASSADGTEERTIVLAVERNTKELEPMIHDSNEI